MTGFSERLSAIKAKQEEVDAQRQEEAERATESARSEQESTRIELFSRQEKLMEEFEEAEKTAREANEAVLESDAFAREQGDSLDPAVAEEIASLKAEAVEVVRKFDELKSELERVSEEIRTFEEGDVDDAIPEKGESTETAPSPESQSQEALEADKAALEGAREKESILNAKIEELNKMLEANMLAKQELAGSGDSLVMWNELYAERGGERKKYLTLTEESQALKVLYNRAQGVRSYQPESERETALKEVSDYLETLKSKGLTSHKDPVQIDVAPVVLFQSLHGARLDTLAEGAMTLNQLFDNSEKKIKTFIENREKEITGLQETIAGLESKLVQNV